MADHQLKEIADAVLARLTTVLASPPTPLYDGISITKGLFRPAWLPAFDQWAVRVAPGGQPWQERTIGIRTIQRVYRFDLFLLCKVTDEDLSLWGDESDTPRGVFQLAQDVKDALRGQSLGGLLDRTFEEVNGEIAFDMQATPGFESSERVLVHRIRMPYTPRTNPFCVSL